MDPEDERASVRQEPYFLHRPDGLESFARSGDYDLIIHGHTHRAEVRKVGETVILNPGEGSGW